MKEYTSHLEEYLTYWFSSYSKNVPEKNWGNISSAEKYLDKYWLNELEYKIVWKPIQEKIFNNDNKLPNLIFTSDFKIVVFKGGCLFDKENYKQLQKAITAIGETHFVIIQNKQDFTSGEPMFRMKFPVTTTWEELMSGNYISAVLFEMNYNEYFVFGSSDRWGRYSATEFKHPIEIVGFKSEWASIFKSQIKQSKENSNEIMECLPLKYKKIINESILNINEY